ncbi:HDOD domain-containing protein [bacterium]|nr:HDOD domain-containing protein [bacterium]
MGSSSPKGLDLDRFRKAPGSGSPPDPAPSAAAPRVDIVAKERRTQAVLASIETLPSLPSVVTQVLQLANDPDASAKDFEEIISTDQALTAKVLKLVNSPFFGLRREVTSVPQAIVVMGMKSLRSIVLAAKTSSLLDRQLTPYGLGISGLWKHSMSCASLASNLSRRIGADQAAQEAAFVGGLLHDVGKVILAPHIAERQGDFDRLCAENDGCVAAAERAVIGLSHAEAGGLMGKRWALPEGLIGVIAAHHDEVSEDEDAQVTIVRIANDVCNQIGVGRLAGAAEPSATWEASLARAGLEGEAENLRQEAAELVTELEPVFAEMAGS